MSKSTLRSKARMLVSIAKCLKLADRPNDQISLQEIEKAASRWSREKYPLPSKRSREQFVSEAVAWLSVGMGSCQSLSRVFGFAVEVTG
jgi:hypothetical protein